MPIKVGKRHAIVERTEATVDFGTDTLTLFLNRRSLGEEFFAFHPEASNGHGEPTLTREQIRGQILACSVGWDAIDEETGKPLPLDDAALRRFDVRDLQRIYEAVMRQLFPEEVRSAN